LARLRAWSRRVGLLPLDGGMVLLQRQVPFRQAMGVVLTGRRAAGRPIRQNQAGGTHQTV